MIQFLQLKYLLTQMVYVHILISFNKEGSLLKNQITFHKHVETHWYTFIETGTYKYRYLCAEFYNPFSQPSCTQEIIV